MPAIIPHGQRNKVIFHNATDIQLVVQTLQGLLMKKFMICISHGTSRITSLSPNQWEAGTSSSDNAGYACQRDAIIIAFFYEKSQDKNDTLVLSKRASLYPRSKERGFRLGNFDNLHILCSLDTDTIDLIYLDPPFNSNRTFAAPNTRLRDRLIRNRRRATGDGYFLSWCAVCPFNLI